MNKNKNHFHNLMVKEYYAILFYFEADHKTSLNQVPLTSNNNEIAISISYLVFGHGAKMIIPKEHTKFSFLNR